MGIDDVVLLYGGGGRNRMGKSFAKSSINMNLLLLFLALLFNDGVWLSKNITSSYGKEVLVA